MYVSYKFTGSGHSLTIVFLLLIGKAYLRRNADFIRAADDPFLALLDSCGCVTAEMARGWFTHAGYVVEGGRG